VLASTSGALFNDLNAQNPNNSANPKMEQIDKNDTQRVTDFMKTLNVTIPTNWIKFASDAIQMLDAEGILSAQKILEEDLPKVAETDRPAYVLMSFDAIRKAYDKEEHNKASEEFFAEYITYENLVKSVTNRFAQDRQKRSETVIAQNKQEINKNKQEISQNKQEINKISKETEKQLLKLYQLNPNDPQLKTFSENSKKLFDSQ
jgi:DNA-directed RNA polymerase subunit H (RpoH/RPB5)